MTTKQHPDAGLTQEQLQAKYGGYWEEHPEFSLEDWQDEVLSESTRQGYWPWVEAQIELWEPEEDKDDET
jgi:hypothetical protein